MRLARYRALGAAPSSAQCALAHRVSPAQAHSTLPLRDHEPAWAIDWRHENPFHAVQGRANPPARVLVLGMVEVGRGLVCLDRKRHFNPASPIEDQGPHSCDEPLLHEIGERRLRAALEAAQVNRVAHGLSLSNAARRLQGGQRENRAA